MQDSNLRPPVCKTDALPTELTAHSKFIQSLREYQTKVKAKKLKIFIRAIFLYTLDQTCIICNLGRNEMPRTSDYLKNLFLIIILLQIAPPLIKSIIAQYSRILEPHTKVAYMDISGFLYDSSYYARHLRDYFKQSDIKAIVLKIETPGGAAGTSENIAHEIEMLKQEYPKPLVTFVENICTSGGYYIACVSDHIIAAPSALIGSIGSAIPYQFKVNEFLEKYDINYVPITAGKFKGSTDPFSPENSEGTAMLQSVADDSYANFKEHVIKYRSLVSEKNESQWAQGIIVTGRQALKRGLIDEVGSQTTVINKIKELAVIAEEIEWIQPVRSTGLAALFAPEEGTALYSCMQALWAVCYRISDLWIK